MNKRQTKKWFKKNFDIKFCPPVYFESEPAWLNFGPSPLEPIIVDLIRYKIACAYALPPHMLFGHRLGGYKPPPLLLEWDGPRWV